MEMGVGELLHVHLGLYGTEVDADYLQSRARQTSLVARLVLPLDPRTSADGYESAIGCMSIFYYECI